MTLAEEKAAVRRGIKLLDLVEPKWFKKIDPKDFNLASAVQCVLGHVYGEYGDGLKAIAEQQMRKLFKGSSIKFLENEPEIDGEYYGFEPGDSNDQAERMGQQWLRAQAARVKRATT